MLYDAKILADVNFEGQHVYGVNIFEKATRRLIATKYFPQVDLARMFSGCARRATNISNHEGRIVITLG